VFGMLAKLHSLKAGLAKRAEIMKLLSRLVVWKLSMIKK